MELCSPHFSLEHVLCSICRSYKCTREDVLKDPKRFYPKILFHKFSRTPIPNSTISHRMYYSVIDQEFQITYNGTEEEALDYLDSLCIRFLDKVFALHPFSKSKNLLEIE